MKNSLTRTFLVLIFLATACRNRTPTVTPTLRGQTVAVMPTSTARASPTAVPVGTATPGPTAKPTATILPSATATATFTPTPTSVPTSTPTVTPSPTATATAIPTATPDPYAGLTIADLSGRDYGGGQLQVEQVLAITPAFTRTLVTFSSDGLSIYGFMNVPQGTGPFPVVILSHGYVDPSIYNTLTYTTRYADALARAGFVAIHPNLRGYAPSDDGPNRFRVGMAVDVLNLIALIRTQGGQPGPLRKADPAHIGLWGHSMGGGITLRTITVAPEVKAAVLYGSMSGDEKQNYERILIWSGGQRGEEELATSEEDLARISPVYHLARITAAVSIHHGELDGTVPLQWSQDLCQRLETLGKEVECFMYAGQPHTFGGEGDQVFIQRSVAFFNRTLKPES